MEQQTNNIDVKLVSVNTTNGVSQSTGKAWTKHELVTETLDQCPKKIVFSTLGEIDPMVTGYVYNIEFYVDSREYNGRWYTNVNIVKISLKQINVPIEQASQQIVRQSHQQYAQQPTQINNMDRQAQAYFDAQPSPSQQNPQPNEPLPF